MSRPGARHVGRLVLGLLTGVISISCTHNASSAMTGPVPSEAPTYTRRPQLVTTADSVGPNANPATASDQHDLVAAIAALNDIDATFGLSDDVLTGGARDRLTQVAEILNRRRSLKLNIEANGDGRRTDDYSLLLGEKRAERAKSFLVHLGAKDEQVATLTSGRDRPRDPAQTERTWQENRRDDVVVQNPLGSP